jgi:hypothetical protein
MKLKDSFSAARSKNPPDRREIGKAVRIDDALGRYIEFAKASSFRAG